MRGFSLHECGKRLPSTLNPPPSELKINPLKDSDPSLLGLPSFGMDDVGSTKITLVTLTDKYNAD